MSLIEQAAKRLEELRRAGVDIPEVESAASGRGAEEAPALRANRAGAPSRHGRGEAEPAPSGEGASHISRIAHVDLQRVASAGIITPDMPRSQLAEEFRVVKRPLLANAAGKGAVRVRNGNLVMITSALPAEGKSFTAVNLAMSIAMELDHTVLLVDADVARPAIPSVLGVPPAPGLLDVLLDESVGLREALIKTNVPKLSVLPSGTQHPRATELLASDAMVRLLEEMASRYSDRIIIFDSPPLLLTTEARVLASHMGQVVMVVQAERTTHGEVKQALATIESCPVKLMVLNKGRAAAKGGYGYGYGYGYGGGYGKGHRPSGEAGGAGPAG